MRLIVAVAMALAALWAAPARGYFGRTIYPCVEAMVGYADSVVRGRIEAVRAGDRRVEVEVEPLETLKGEKASDRIVVAVTEGRPWEECLSRGGECVLFRSKTGRKAFSFADYQGAVMVDEKLGFYDLTRRHANTFDIRMQRLSDREEVLGAVKAAATFEKARGSPAPPADYWPWMSLPLRLNTPTGTVQTVYSSELLLPLDERLETVVEEWGRSADAEWRVVAVRAASRLDTKRSRAVIERLLEDGAYIAVPMGCWDPRREWRQRRVYFVRQAAWDGMAVKPRGKAPLLEGPSEGIYVAVGLRGWVLFWTAVVVVIAAAVWVGRRSRSWGAGTAVVCAALLGLVGWMWIDNAAGGHRCLSFAGAGSEQEIVLLNGRLHWLRVHDEPGWRGIAVRTHRGPEESGSGPWFEEHLAADSSKGFLGVTASSGQTKTPGAGVVAYPYHLLQVRITLLAGLLAAWPVVFGVRGFARAMRRKFWVAMGRCGGCGYDVRWGAGKCPECGLENL